MNLWKKTFAVEPDPPASPEDFLAAADADLKNAEAEFAQAHFLTNQFYVRNREYPPIINIAGQTNVRIHPPNAELAALQSRENHAIQKRNQAMQRRAELRERFLPEQKFVAGVRV